VFLFGFEIETGSTPAVFELDDRFDYEFDIVEGFVADLDLAFDMLSTD
jgi:hypothetical protein